MRRRRWSRCVSFIMSGPSWCAWRSTARLAQDYPAIEVVLVDDGSEGAAALSALDALEVEFGERGWRVIRQENRYQGRSPQHGGGGCCSGRVAAVPRRRQRAVPGCSLASCARRAFLRRGLRSRREHPLLRRRGPEDSKPNPTVLRSASWGPRAPGATFSQRGRRCLRAGTP